MALETRLDMSLKYLCISNMRHKLVASKSIVSPMDHSYDVLLVLGSRMRPTLPPSCSEHTVYEVWL